MLDIVIPYIKNNSGELDACLKLIDKNMKHGKIHIVETHERSPYRFAPHIDQIMKLKWAVENLNISDDFYLFNDDFFVMKPIDSVPYYFRGLLRSHIASRTSSDWYTNSLRKTLAYLGECLSYELHVPFPMNKTKLYEMLKDIDHQTFFPHIRTAYGNKYAIGGELIKDVKNVSNFTDKTFLSTTESSFKRGAIGEYIRDQI